MYLYIDKSNLESLIKSRTKPLYSDCIKAIRNQLNVFFNFSKKELQSSEELSTWFLTFTEGIPRENTFIFLDEYLFPKRPIEEDLINEFNENKLSSIYLLSDENIKKLKELGAVLVGEPGEELDIFNKIFLLQNDYDFHKEILIGGNELRKWKDLEKFSLPLTDIIFVDSYIIDNTSLVTFNLINYLEVLCSKSKSTVNIVLYVNKYKIGITYSKLKEILKPAIQKITGKEPKLTLIKYSTQRGVKHLGEHDRTVFTNYMRIKSGDTYNYFKSNGEVITNGREISYNSLCKRQTYNLSKNLISDLQENINFLKQNGDSIEGDKVSNFLKFT